MEASSVKEAGKEHVFHMSLSLIAAELEELQAGAEKLHQLYAETAEINDLTFIKIIEERYSELVHTFRTLSAKIHEETRLWEGS